MSINNAYPSGSIVGIANTGVAGPTTTITTTGTTGINWPATNTNGIIGTSGQLTIPGIWGYGTQSVSTDPLAAFVTPAGEHFVRMYATMQIKGPEGVWTLGDVLALCKNIKYMAMNGEIILFKPIWEALQIYIKSEDGYAGLTPSEYLDKMFGPK